MLSAKIFIGFFFSKVNNATFSQEKRVYFIFPRGTCVFLLPLSQTLFVSSVYIKAFHLIDFHRVIIQENPSCFLSQKERKEMNFVQEKNLVGFSENLFDRLPDDVLLLILNKLNDAKSLCLSLSVCKRFNSIIPQIDQIFLPIPTKKGVITAHDRERKKKFFKNLFVRTLIKPLHFISKVLKFKAKKENCDCHCDSYHAINEILKPFEEIRSLHLRLPCKGSEKLDSKTGDSKNNFTTFLKWKAEFGSQMQSCVLLGAKSWTDNQEKAKTLQETGHRSSVIPDEELKLRIVWTISCLIAASARHELIQEIVKDQRTIENMVITDESEQGEVCMNKEQIEELRDLYGKEEDGMMSESEDRISRVSSLRMKMWYADKLEVPSLGKVLEGATLVVIRPVEGGAKELKRRKDGDLVAAAFGGEGEESMAIGEAARKVMAAKRHYTFEMTSCLSENFY